MSEDPSPGEVTRKPPWYRRLWLRWRQEPYSRGQLVLWLRNAERAHLIDSDTLATMEGALQVLDMRVRDIMVPRSDMVVLEENASPRELLPKVVESGHSRFPVIDTKREVVVGVLMAKDLLANLGQSHSRFDIKDVMRPAVFVPESKRLNILLREFRSSRNHMAIVVDEYGGIAGLVSIEDVIEQIVGEIDDEHDVSDEYFIRPHGRSRYTVRARTPIADFNEYFGSTFADDEYDTIGGLLLKQFGHVPERGEEIDFGGFNFKILRADVRRIHLMRIVRTAQVTDTAQATAS
jgi:magnesium and cobalt transporter